MASLQRYITHLKKLANKKVSETTLCPICGLVEGTARHTLWLSPTAQDVWCQTPVKFQKISSNSSFFADIWKQLIEKLSCMELNEVVYILKYIWFRCNTYIHQHTFTHPNNLLHKAKEEFSQFLNANSIECHSPQAPQTEHKTTRWLKPPFNVIKVNWDTTYFQQKEMIGVGVIAQDHNGQVLGTMRIKRKIRGDAFIDEVWLFSLRLTSVLKQVSQMLYLKGMPNQWSKKSKMHLTIGVPVPS